jgi:hypothetical protein
MTRLLSATLAAALALTPITVTPSKAADAEDIAGVLAGLVAIAVLSRALDDDKPAARTTTTSSARVASGADSFWDEERDGYWVRDGRTWRFVPQHDDRKRHKKTKRRADRKTLPEACLFTFETDRGNYRAFSEHCLKNRMRRDVRHLPDHCERTIRTRRGNRDIYMARCLRRAGWTVEARHR